MTLHARRGTDVFVFCAAILFMTACAGSQPEPDSESTEQTGSGSLETSGETPGGPQSGDDQKDHGKKGEHADDTPSDAPDTGADEASPSDTSTIRDADDEPGAKSETTSARGSDGTALGAETEVDADVLFSSAEGITDCAKMAAEHWSFDPGKLDYKVVIGKRGDVQRVALQKNTTGSDELGECVRRVLLQRSYPAPAVPPSTTFESFSFE